MKITQHSVVSMHYTLTDSEGTELDSSSGSEPLTYLHGTGGLIPGLEREMEGRGAGESFKATIEADDGYGQADPQLIQQVPLESLSQIENLEVGMQLQSQSPDGHTRVIVVESIGEENATLNANHPLAGVTLHFEVSIESIREATEEELEHGHAHGGDGHSH
jgi:FKBP-type peptidyl-prolyl cis-trans isomerase SlyD